MNTIVRRRPVRRRRQKIFCVKRFLRDSADPLAMDEDLFVQSYRVTKHLYTFLCTTLANHLNAPQRCTSISVELKVLTTLNFLATGSVQKTVGNDWMAPLSQPSASRCIHEVVEALNVILPSCVQFPTSDHDRNKIKQGFYEKFGMPGVLGCISGALVSILAPRHHPSEAAFLSHKGYHAINAAIICDSELEIIGICAKFGGAAQDSYIWQWWSINRYLEEEYINGRTGWLLGDSGYPQKPWLMTPITNAAENTPEAYYTDMHVRTRVCIEQCIKLMKARWQCLCRHRVLHYEPIKCAKIINACAVLHNLCLNDQIITLDSIGEDSSESSSNDGPIESLPIESLADEHARQELIQVLWDNRT